MRALSPLLHLLLVCSVVSPAWAQAIRREPLILREGGTPEKPAVFDGKGMIIDLGIDVTDRDWQRDGDVWTSRGPFPSHPPTDDVQRAGLFIDEVPLRIVRDRAREEEGGKAVFVAPAALQPGQMGFAADGSFHFRWPAGKKPGAARIILPAAKLASCVSIQCSHITVRNLTARYAGNDGFNIHGARVGIRLENVKALSNADEGISAHETVEMEVEGAEIAWNGSSAGGVADVNESVTSYKNCELHHNLGAAFFFAGKRHRIIDCVVHHQSQDVVIRGTPVVEKSGLVWRRE